MKRTIDGKIILTDKELRIIIQDALLSYISDSNGNNGRIEGNIPDVSDLISNISYANDAFVQDNISEMNEGLIMTHDINSVKNIICRTFSLRPQQFCITSRNFDNTIVYLGVIILEKGASQNVIGEIKHYMQTFGYFECVKPKYVEEKIVLVFESHFSKDIYIIPKNKHMITKINENDLKKLVTEVIRDILSESLTEISYYDELYEACSPKHFKEVKYFSPDGRKNIPNGHPIQKGGFISECKANLNNFILSEGVRDSQYGLSEYRGGVIVFSTEVNAVKLDKKMSDETIGAYSIGNAFKGKYVGDNGEEYNEHSMSIEINGLSSEALLYLAEMIARVLHQETVLIKDSNKNKIYLANGLRQNNPYV